ncbi:MAG: molecular chaperone DnaJ [Oscillospiraceae bacterium]|nr:molecular chaperone DnaJ [Oscillospiraceae bacterium]
MAEKRDFYEILGVPKTASDDEIKKAYRKKAKQYHPDLNPDDAAAEARMKEVNEAFEILSDPQTKARYDRFGHAGVDPNSAASGGGFHGAGFDFGDLGDLFGGIFGGGFTGSAGRSAQQRRGSDLEERVILSFEEAARGCRRVMELNRVEPCDDCAGTGAAKGTSAKSCPECGGTGQKNVQQRTPFGVISSSRPCPRCNGTGKIIETPCPKCRGGGRVRKRTSVEITIPAGIDDGQAMSVRGEGNKGPNGAPAGDLVVIVSVRPHPVFERDGFDLWSEVKIQFWQAALGDTIQVPTLDGTVEQKIPAGTLPGTVFTRRGQGIPVLQGGGRKGDAHVRVQVDVPDALSAEQRAMLEQSRALFPAKAIAVAPKDPPKQPPPDEKHGFFNKKRK